MVEPEDIQNRIKTAICSGRIHEVRRVLQTNRLPLCRDSSELLSVAIKLKKLNIFDLLLAHGCRVNSVNRYADSPLHQAARDGKVNFMKKLLSRNAKVNAQNEKGFTALHLAVKNLHRAAVKLLLNQRADVDICSFPDAAEYWYQSVSTPLIVAIEKGNLEIAELILQKRAVVNQQIEGITPIHVAAKRANRSMCELLTRYGADLSALDQAGKSVLFYAVEGRMCETAEFLLEREAAVNHTTLSNNNPIFESAVTGDETMFTLLLNHGAKIDLQMIKDGKTILHYAIKKRHKSMVEYILQNCNVTIENFPGLLRLAVEEENIYAFYFEERHETFVNYELLYNFGFRFSADDLRDTTFIFNTAKAGFASIVKEFLRNGVDIHLRMGPDRVHTPIFMSSVLGDEKLFTMLLRFGAEIDLQMTENGKSILHHAIEHQL